MGNRLVLVDILSLTNHIFFCVFELICSCVAFCIKDYINILMRLFPKITDIN